MGPFRKHFTNLAQEAWALVASGACHRKSIRPVRIAAALLSSDHPAAGLSLLPRTSSSSFLKWGAREGN